MKPKQKTGDGLTNVSKALEAAKGSPALSDLKVTGWPLMACIYLVFIQPILLFVIPLVRYDENRLPGLEEIYMLSLSARGWRDLVVAVYGIIIGRLLWQSRPDGVRLFNRYLFFTIFSSLTLLILPFLIPFHSFLRKEVRVEMAVGFLQTLAVFVVGFAYFRSSKHVDNLYHRPDDFTLSSRPTKTRTGLTALITSVVGITFVMAGFFTKPIDVFEAAWEGDLPAVNRFISEGVDVNVTTTKANVALHLARTREVADFLISTGSKLEQTFFFSEDDFKNFPGWITKLRSASDPVSAYLFSQLSRSSQQDVAAGRRSMDDLRPVLVAELNEILRRGSLLVRSESFAALHLSGSTMKPVVKSLTGAEAIQLNRLLLEDAYPNEIARCAVDVRNSLRETPLHLASFDGRLGVSQILLDQGANVNAQNKFGLTPLDHALFGKATHRKGDFEGVIALLVSKGGKAHSPTVAMPDVAQLGGHGWAARICWDFWLHLLV